MSINGRAGVSPEFLEFRWFDNNGNEVALSAGAVAGGRGRSAGRSVTTGPGTEVIAGTGAVAAGTTGAVVAAVGAVGAAAAAVKTDRE